MSDKSKPHILLVEDNRDARIALTMLFAGEGYEVVPAADGEEGFLLAVTSSPDLIITDICMPNTSGPDLIAMLRADPKTRNIPVLVTTAAESGQADMAAELGVYGVLKKPFDFDEFLPLVSGLVGKAEGPALNRLPPDPDDASSQGQ